MDKLMRIEPITESDLTSTIDIMDEITKSYAEAEDKRIFEEYRANGRFSEAVLIMNPKHKGAMEDFLNTNGLKIPVIWYERVEEDKAYMINDKDMAKNVRKMYESNS